MSLLVAGSVVGTAGSASALEPVPDLYTVNVADQSASSYARDFVVLGSKTYFTASSVSYGRSIWSLATTAGATPQLVLDPVEDAIHGKIEKMTAVGNYLLFWLNDTLEGQGDFTAVAYNLVTRTMTKLAVGGTEVTSSNGVMSNFAVVVGGSGSVAHVIGGQDGANSQKLYAFDLTSGVASVADTMADLRITNNYRDGLNASGQNWQPTLSAVGSKLYIANFVSVSPPAGSYCVSWGYSDWSELRAFDTTTDLWSSAIQVPGEDFPLAGATVLGTFDYEGESVMLSAAASVKGCYFNHTFQYYATKADGTTSRLGSWATSGTSSFVNLNGSLYLLHGGLWEILPESGERTNSAATMFPAAAEVGLRNAVAVDGHLVFGAQVQLTSGAYNTPIYLYQWDGTSAATRLATAPLGQAVGVAPNTPSIYDWYTNNEDTDYQALGAIGRVGTKAITSLNVDGVNGGEPYLVSLDDTKTLVSNLNKGSDGSDPDTDCFANFDNVDFIAGNLPVQTSDWGKDVFVELKGEDGYLKYSVLDPGNIGDMCGFVVIDDELFFTAQDNETNDDALYRMGVDRVIHKVVDARESEQGFTNGTDYIFRAYSDYNTDWWMWNGTTNEVIQLSGTGSDLIEEDSVESRAVQIGSLVYFVAEPEGDGDDSIWTLDLTDPTAPPVRIIPERAEGVDSDPWNLTVVAGKLVFSNPGIDGAGAENGGDSVYLYNPATTLLTELFDPAADGTDGYVERIFELDGKAIVLYHADDDPSDSNIVFRTTLAGVATKLSFPAGYTPYCAAPAGNDLAVSSDEGVAYFYRQGGSTMVPISYSFVGDTSALCESVSSVNGTYLSMPEYPFDYGPWSTEPGYLGFLTPIAIERLGESVDEPPASPYSPTPPPADAPGTVGTPVATVGDGSINLSWSAPTTGGTPGGYRVTSTPAGALCVIVGTTASCTGLTVGVEYTFLIEAYNINGFGSASSLSNSVVAPEGSDAGFGEGGSGDGGGSGGGGDGDGGGSGGGDGSGGSGSGDGSDGSTPAGLAATGFANQGLIPLGILLLGFGAFFAVRGARRRASR